MILAGETENRHESEYVLTRHAEPIVLSWTTTCRYVIMQIGDKPVEHSADLTDQDAVPQSGTKVHVKLMRNRKQMTIKVNLTASAHYAGTGVSDVGPLDHLALSMHPLMDDEWRSTGLAEGLMVKDISGIAGTAKRCDGCIAG